MGVGRPPRAREKAALEERARLGDDARLRRVERQAQTQGSARLGNAAIAEVEAEQLDIIVVAKLDPSAGPPATRTGRASRTSDSLIDRTVARGTSRRLAIAVSQSPSLTSSSTRALSASERMFV